MATIPALAALPGTANPLPALAALPAKPLGDAAAKARAQATDFEAVFLHTMFSQMFTGIDGEGPFGGSGAAGVWRSFLSDEYAKSFAKAGGIGLADHVYRALLDHQAAKSQ
jgi:peptidoglycan hydrolase FlgJ